jgi:glutamine amidotransferase
VLPGVGAFSGAMFNLKSLGFSDALITYARSGRPILGICLGMQLLFDVSEEFGEFSGLGLISGRISPVPETGIDDRPHKIPHVGWSKLYPPGKQWNSPLFSGISNEASVYFVHSFAASLNPLDQRVSALTEYDGIPIVAAVELGNIYGCQFHPEKSGSVGLSILSNFLSIHAI